MVKLEMIIRNAASFFMLSLFLIGGCSKSQPEEGQDKVNVIVTILPQKAFVEAVGRDLVHATEMISAGGSPATYEPMPEDLKKVEKADIYFMIGHLPFERSHIGKLSGLNADMRIVDTSTNVKLRYLEDDDEHTHADEEGEESRLGEGEAEKDRLADPHIWLSPVQAKNQVDVIVEALIEIDPENSDEYRRNALVFKQELDNLHDELQQSLSELKYDKILVFHPAWGYFADEYGLEQIAIEHDGKEPTAEQLKEQIGRAREEGIKAIFVQSQFNKQIAQSVADEVGAAVILIDPLAEDYIVNLRGIGETIAGHLNGQGST
ncbi:zinc ABC transporter substrate-binding protein [Candidatus Woesearchaeota archaeon]|nr:zinc ABC transporter substrate-binding protein [Candidatus Woesearchaeota archaeon]